MMSVILFLFLASQFYWGWVGYGWLRKRVPGGARRAAIMTVVASVYIGLVVFNVGFARGQSPTHLTLPAALLVAPFEWWVPSSIVACLVLLILGLVRLVVNAPVWVYRRVARKAPPLESPARRAFLSRATTVAAASPFVAGSYGLLYGRLNLQTTEQRVHLPRLPKAFDGFRIVQLSDIHIGPFMTDSEIRKYVAIANSLRADLAVLTGDYVTWDPSPQYAVVNALSGLRAPYGVFGCLGNHDAWAGVEASITELFRQAGFRILRQERVDVAANGESFNLIGIDFQSLRRFGPGGTRIVRRFLDGLENLVTPDRTNILLSHNPDTFDRAAALGIDLSMAGHTHGGQVALEFISPEIAPCRLVTPYVQGWFEKPGGQLYVNRGIGTIGVPIRLGAPPEITVYELKRGLGSDSSITNSANLRIPARDR